MLIMLDALHLQADACLNLFPLLLPTHHLTTQQESAVTCLTPASTQGYSAVSVHAAHVATSFRHPTTTLKEWLSD